MKFSRLATLALVLGTVLAAGITKSFAHGDVQPQPVDTTGLDALEEGEWLTANPYSGNPVAIKIGNVRLHSELRALPRLGGHFRRPRP